MIFPTNYVGGNNVVKGCESRLVSKFIGKHKYMDIHRTLFFYHRFKFCGYVTSSLSLLKLDISSA